MGPVDYASVLALELHAPATPQSEPVVVFQFKNGTGDPSFHPVTLSIFGGNATSVPLSTFVDRLEVGDTINEEHELTILV